LHNSKLHLSHYVAGKYGSDATELSSKLNTEVFLQLLASCMEEVKLWRVRLPRRDANLAETWTGVLRAGM
jgi:hypothetical protein